MIDFLCPLQKENDPTYQKKKKKKKENKERKKENDPFLFFKKT